MTTQGCSWLGGNFKHRPQELKTQLSSEAKALIECSFADLNASKLVDHHVHLVGSNPLKSGTFVNKNWQSFFRDPKGYIQFSIYKSASDIKDMKMADEHYLKRLKELVTFHPAKGRYGLMAFDYFHHETGHRDLNLSTFRVPNDYMLKIVKSASEYFFPIISIHPYRKDALSNLRHYAKKGVRFIKWLPNSMGINPSSTKKAKELTAFYEIMKKHDMVLITHTGDEKAIHAKKAYQHLGNPYYLKMPLDQGIKVVMAHFASLGHCKEHEVKAGICREDEAYIDIAMQMMRESKYQNNLFAEISAITQFNRQHTIPKILTATDLHPRIINGSDYPLPAVNAVIRTGKLEDAGFITKDERRWLNEIYHYNPLLFDYVLKRTIKIEHKGVTLKLPPSIFMKNSAFRY